MTSEANSQITPEIALTRLKEGNGRFVLGQCIHPNSDNDRRLATSKDGQKPFAVILGCSDSRVPVEVIFDRGIGDIFTVRIAGNVCNYDEIACVEYAVEQLATPLVVVLGHTDCALVKAVATGMHLRGSLAMLGSNIRMAVSKARQDNPGISGAALIQAAVVANVRQSIDDLLGSSPLIRDNMKSGNLAVVGGVYNLETGVVEWL